MCVCRHYYTHLVNTVPDDDHLKISYFPFFSNVFGFGIRDVFPLLEFSGIVCAELVLFFS